MTFQHIEPILLWYIPRLNHVFTHLSAASANVINVSLMAGNYTGRVMVIRKCSYANISLKRISFVSYRRFETQTRASQRVTRAS